MDRWKDGWIDRQTDITKLTGDCMISECVRVCRFSCYEEDKAVTEDKWKSHQRSDLN